MRVYIYIARIQTGEVKYGTSVKKGEVAYTESSSDVFQLRITYTPTMFITHCWISSLFLIVVKGEINESRWATEIHTEIVTQTLFTGCDPMLDKDCSGPINRPSEYSSSNGAVEFLGVGTTRESSQGTLGEASYTTSSDSPTMDHITTRTLYEEEETPILAAVVRDANENQTRVKGGIIEPRVVYKECKTVPEQSPCLTCSGGKNKSSFVSHSHFQWKVFFMGNEVSSNKAKYLGNTQL